MSPKLATAMVCIGIAVGTLSAPKAPQSCSRPGHPISPTVQPLVIQSEAKGRPPVVSGAIAIESVRDKSLDSIQAQPSPNNVALTVPIPAEASFIAPSLSNTFRVAIQH